MRCAGSWTELSLLEMSLTNIQEMGPPSLLVPAQCRKGQLHAEYMSRTSEWNAADCEYTRCCGRLQHPLAEAGP